MSDVGGGERLVTAHGHDLTVWQGVLDAAPRVRLNALVQALSPETRFGQIANAGKTADAGNIAETGPTLVVVSAHPDDETLGSGRLAYAWAEAVGPVVGVLATAGEACFDHVMERPVDLAIRRIDEWRTATTRLGFTGRRLLGLPDGQLDRLAPDLLTALHLVVGELSLDRQVVLAAPWRGDPHPDHSALGLAAARVAEMLGVVLVEYPVWMTYWAAPAALPAARAELVVLETDDRADQAHADASRAFVSQLEPMAPNATAVVPAAMLEHHRSQLLIVSPALARELVGPPGAP